MALLELRHILLDVLPSPAMMVQGRELRIQNHLAMIRDHLWAINAVIVDAEIRALKERDLEDWMAHVSAAIGDLGDLLDGILDSNPLFGRAIVRKLKKMTSRLNDLMIFGESTFNLRKEMMNGMDPRREEYFTILRDEVVGRDDDLDNIIELLQRQKYNSDGVPSFIAIRGDKGMGKTTLARMIYLHPWVRQHFHPCIWVDLSKHFLSFDFLSIARECVESITGEPSGHLQDPYLQLQEALGGSRYFLVLDDFNHPTYPISTRTIGEFQQKWDQLYNILLRAGGPGSTVIITTADYGKDLLRLKRVSEDDWVKLLFVRHASFIIQPDHHQPSIHHIDLLPIFAKQLYHKHSLGQPSQAKLLGSLFRYTEVSRWQQLVPFVQEYRALLRLDYLPINQNRLYLYASLFQENPYDTEDLVHMMIIEGLIPHDSDKNVMARTQLLSLWGMGWKVLQPVRSPYYFTMRVGQDLQIPRQCRHLCLLFNFNDSNASIFSMGLSAGALKKLKRLILLRKEEEEMVPKVQKCQIAKFLEAMFVHLLNLRILHLRESRIQVLPSTVGKLLNLRYLNLFCTDIETLPGSLCNLGNLQILNLSLCLKLRKLPRRIHKLRELQILKLAYCEKLRMLPESITALANLQELDLECCRWLVQLPEGFGNMKRLTQLNMHKCVSLTRMPRGIGQLISLRKLLGFAIDGDLGSITQQELQPLLNLEELRLRVPSSKDIRNIKLQEKLKLKNLALHWEWWNMDDDDVDKASLINLQQQVLEDFRPNSVLEELKIISYMGQKLPSWMTERELYVISLVEIKLVNLKRCERLPTLGQLPHLKIVEISGMDSINVVDEAFHGDGYHIFPSLKKLTFSQMPALEKWTMGKNKEEDDQLFIYLQELTLIQCPKFRTLEVCLPGISYLRIWLDNNEMLLTSNFMGWHNFNRHNSDYRELEIIGCDELECLPEGMRNLEKIQTLIIIGCRRLTSLPNWLEEWKDLIHLDISSCPALSFFPEGIMK